MKKLILKTEVQMNDLVDGLKRAEKKMRRHIDLKDKGKIGDWYVYEFNKLNFLRAKTFKHFLSINLKKVCKNIEKVYGKTYKWELKEIKEKEENE